MTRMDRRLLLILYVTLLVGLGLTWFATHAEATQANLSWTPPALVPTDPQPTSILVQKAATLQGPFSTLHTLAPSATTDSDPTVVIGAQVCYQVVWVYPLGNAILGPMCGTPAVGKAGTNFTIIFMP